MRITVSKLSGKVIGASSGTDISIMDQIGPDDLFWADVEEFEAFKKKLRIPYTSIKNVEDTAGDVFGKFKIMGTRLTQNSHDYGSFTTDEGEGFFAYKTRENAFAIHLTNHQYGIIIIELENREQVINELRSRMANI